MLIIVEHKKVILIFALFRTAIFSVYFQAIKNYFFFLFNNIIEDYSSKWKTKKQKEEKKKQKSITKPIMTNYEKNMRKLKNESMLIIKIKICLMKIEVEKKTT